MPTLYRPYKSLRPWSRSRTTKVPREGQRVVVKTRKGYVEGILSCVASPCSSNPAYWRIQVSLDPWDVPHVPLLKARVVRWLSSYQRSWHGARRIDDPAYTPRIQVK